MHAHPNGESRVPASSDGPVATVDEATFDLPAIPAPSTDAERAVAERLMKWGTPVLGYVALGNEANDEMAEWRLSPGAAIIDPLLAYVRAIPSGAPATSLPLPQTEQEWKALESLADAGDPHYPHRDVDTTTEFGRAVSSIEVRFVAARHGTTESRVRLAYAAGDSLVELAEAAASQEYGRTAGDGYLAGALIDVLVKGDADAEDALPQMVEQFGRLMAKADRAVAAAASALGLEHPRTQDVDWNERAAAFCMPPLPAGADASTHKALESLAGAAYDAWRESQNDATEVGAWVADFHFKLEAFVRGVTPAMCRQSLIIGDGAYDLVDSINADDSIEASRQAGALEEAYAPALRGKGYDPKRLAAAREAFFESCSGGDAKQVAHLSRDCDRADAMLAAFYEQDPAR